MVGLWFMFLRAVVRASTKSLVVIIMIESESLSTESLKLIISQQGIGHLGVNGLLEVSGLSMGVGVWWGLNDECYGERTGVPLGVLTSDGHSVSFGTNSSVDGYSGDPWGTGVTLSSPLSKGEIIGSTGITLWGLSVNSAESLDCLLTSLSLLLCSGFSLSCSLNHCQTVL